MNPLNINIENDELVIRIGIDTLTCATEYCPSLATWSDEKNDFRKVTVTDKIVWAKEVIDKLKEEAEDGTTLVHIMFDTAFTNAVENGAEGIEIEGIYYE